MTISTLLSFAMLLLFPPASAGEAVDKSLPANPDANVDIDNICGTVKIVAWDREEVQVTGTLDEPTSTIRMNGGKSRIEIELTNEGPADLGCGQLEIKLPPGVRLEIETVSADVGVAGITGTLDLETVSGDVQVQGEPSEIEIETVSGDVVVSADTPAVSVETVSGDVSIHAARGRLAAETVSGEIEIEGGPYSRVQVTSVSGDVDLSGTILPAARVELGTHSGDVSLIIAPPENVAWALSTFSGRIEGFLAEHKVSGFGPGTTLAYLQGDGTTGITVSTHSGDIDIQRK